MRNKNKNWKTIATNIFLYIMFYLLIFFIIDYLFIHTLTHYAEATELPNTITDPENAVDVDNSEYGLDNIILEEEMRILEIVACTSGTICITFVIIYTFGIPSAGFISSLSSIWW